MTDFERLKQDAKVIGIVTEKEIEVEEGYSEPDIESTSGGIRICLGRKDDHFETKTDMEEMLSFALANSPMHVFKYQSHKLLSGIKTNYQDSQKALKASFHILEEVRAKSFWSHFYKGSQKRFQEKANKVDFGDIEDPVTALRAASYGKDISQTEFREAADYVKKVEKLGDYGAIKLAYEYFVNVIQPWLKESEKQEETEDPQTEEELDKQLQQKMQQASTTQKMRDQCSKERSGESFKGMGSSKSIEDLISKSIEEFKESGEKELKKIGKKLEKLIEQEDDRISNGAGGVTVHEMFGDGGQPAEPFMEVVRKLKRRFMTIKGKPMRDYDESGIDLDVDEYIQSKVTKSRNFMIDEKMVTGFDVVIGLDCSGSMGGESMRMAKSICATLYKTFEDTPNVKIKVIGWQGGHSANVVEINNMSDLSYLHASGGTPLGSSTAYCRKVIENMSGQKRILFQITDGSPNSGDYDVNLTKQTVADLRRKGIETFGILVGRRRVDETMTKMFGKNAICVLTFDSVKDILLKDLTKTIEKHLVKRL